MDVVVAEVTSERAVTIVTTYKVVGWVVDLASTAGGAGWIFHTTRPSDTGYHVQRNYQNSLKSLVAS